MRENNGKIIENKMLADGIYRMTIESNRECFTAPGQFAMLSVPGLFLRRPISVSSYNENSYTLIYRVVGKGTLEMSRMEIGETVSAITGCGNGFSLEEIPEECMVIGGGIGIPPLFELTRQLRDSGKKCKVVLGFNTVDEIFLLDDFRELTEEIVVVTADGSYGIKGLVSDAFDHCEYACACGPLPMLRALSDKVKKGKFSLEARMACGFGACMGCSIKTEIGSMRVCKEGPVFDKEVLLWKEIR